MTSENKQKKLKRIAISYSSDDYDVAELVFRYLNSRLDSEKKKKYEVILDRISFGNADFVSTIVDSFQRADVVIILISNNSLKSPWVQFELNMALGRQIVSDIEEEEVEDKGELLVPDVRIVPVLASPVDQIPKNNVVLQYLNMVDYTTSDEDMKPLDNIALRVDEILGIQDESETKFINVRRQFNLQTNKTRMYKQLGEVFSGIIEKKTGAFSEKLDSINRAFAASTSLLSPAHISIKERDANEAIWVVSADLYNDLHLSEFEESIIQNYKRGLKYVYFIENAERFDEMVRRYTEIYGKIDLDDNELPNDNTVNFDFVPLAPGTVMPFDEVVIYDPKAGRITSSYVQITFDQHPNKQTVYIDLPLSATEKMVNKLDDIYKKYLKKKERTK